MRCLETKMPARKWRASCKIYGLEQSARSLVVATAKQATECAADEIAHGVRRFARDH